MLIAVMGTLEWQQRKGDEGGRGRAIMKPTGSERKAGIYTICWTGGHMLPQVLSKVQYEVKTSM